MCSLRIPSASMFCSTHCTFSFLVIVSRTTAITKHINSSVFRSFYVWVPWTFDFCIFILPRLQFSKLFLSQYVFTSTTLPCVSMKLICRRKRTAIELRQQTPVPRWISLANEYSRFLVNNMKPIIINYNFIIFIISPRFNLWVQTFILLPQIPVISVMIPISHIILPPNHAISSKKCIQFLLPPHITLHLSPPSTVVRKSSSLLIFSFSYIKCFLDYKSISKISPVIISILILAYKLIIRKVLLLPLNLTRNIYQTQLKLIIIQIETKHYTPFVSKCWLIAA